MDTARDLRLVLLALGDGLIDPERLSAAAREWSPDNAPFLDFLAARGWITTGQLLKLEAVVGGAPPPDLVPGALTAAEPVAESEQPTPTLPGTFDRGSAAPPTGGRYR